MTDASLVPTVVTNQTRGAYAGASDDVWFRPKYDALFIQIPVDGRARLLNEKV